MGMVSRRSLCHTAMGASKGRAAGWASRHWTRRPGNRAGRRPLCRAYGGSAEGNGIAHLLASPNPDRDGNREVFTAALLDGRTFDKDAWNKKWLFVAACSGRDGRTLRQTVQPAVGNPRLQPLRWGPSGADGRATLMVTVVDPYLAQKGLPLDTVTDSPAQTLLLATSTGRLEHRWPGVTRVGTADFMGNGLADIYGISMASEQAANCTPCAEACRPPGNGWARGIRVSLVGRIKTRPPFAAWRRQVPTPI